MNDRQMRMVSAPAAQVHGPRGGTSAGTLDQLRRGKQSLPTPPIGGQPATHALAVKLHWVLRIGVALEFFGHGLAGFYQPVAWIPYFTFFGMSESFAHDYMTYITGTVDIALAVLVLVRPMRAVMLHMALWGLMTAWLRPLTGESWFELVERGANYGMPLALLVLSGWGGRSLGSWFERVRPPERIGEELARRLAWSIRASIALLLVGHGGLGIWVAKQEWFDFLGWVGVTDASQAAHLMPWVGAFEVVLGLAVLIKPLRGLLLFVLAWKLGSELLRPLVGQPNYQFVERAGDYVLPLALFWLAGNVLPAAGADGDGGRKEHGDEEEDPRSQPERHLAGVGCGSREQLGHFLLERKVAFRRFAGATFGLISLVVVVAAPTAEAGIVTENLAPLPVEVAAAVQPAEAFLEESSGSVPTLPADPVATLIEALRSLSSDMGIPRDPTGAVLKAGLSPEVAGSIALLAQEALACERITRTHMSAMAPSVLKNPAKEYGRALNPSDFNDIRHCARKLWKSTNDVEKALTGAIPSTGADVDFWPVLRYSRSRTNDTYLNDYAITIDAGGDDTYVNNVGSNVIDVNFGPPGQPGLKGEGPARGCQQAIAGITGPPPHCIPAVGVLVDLAGNDRHGVKQAPDVDAQCTADPVVRRMLTNGAGFLGVGVLVDGGGNDRYTAKTASNGTGHLFGVGILHDKAGDDRYLEVRNSTGFALFGGLGVFRDYAGDDSHDFYMPKPLDPDAPNQTPGAGGVIDDEDACDNLPRYNVGGANLGGVGVVIDDAGNDTYRGGYSPNFLAPGGTGRGGSLGFGNNGASGILLDRAGADSYTIVGGDQGSPTRGDGVTILPGADSTGTGAFRDV